MAYLALYRKYRPTGFDGLIGQDHVVTTLVNQIESGRIGHAYLFTGTRGTGKTSAAKIFAKAINCLSPKNGSPCGMCEACRALADPSNLDVMEIDAASNNGVAEIRDLREKITFPPVSCRYKVYIVDEVHMLSSSAFNALLKTLEEPPKHAVFILATTEVHKMPQTILSRCMRFDFKLVPTPVIAELLKKIFRDVGKDFEDEAVTAIARAGEGSVRDALSIADLCVSYSKEKLTYRDVLEVLGSADKEKLYNFTDALLGGDAGGVLSAVNELASTGKSMGVLTKDVTGILRELLVARTCKNANEILGLPEDVFRRVSASAAETDAERLLRCLDIFARAESDLKYAVHPRVVFETAAVKAATPACDYDIEALMARVKELERKLERGVPAAPAAAPAPVPKASEEAPVRPVLTETAEPFRHGGDPAAAAGGKGEPAVLQSGGGKGKTFPVAPQERALYALDRHSGYAPGGGRQHGHAVLQDGERFCGDVARGQRGDPHRTAERVRGRHGQGRAGERRGGEGRLRQRRG